MSVDLDRELRAAFPAPSGEHHDVDALWRRGRRRARARTALSGLAGVTAVLGVVAVLTTVARPTPLPVIGELASPTATPTDREGAFVVPDEAGPSRIANAAGGGLVVMAHAPIVSGAQITTRLVRIDADPDDETTASSSGTGAGSVSSSGGLTTPGTISTPISEPGLYLVSHELLACPARGCTQASGASTSLPLLSSPCRQVIDARPGTLTVLGVTFDSEQPAGCATERLEVDDGAFTPVIAPSVVGSTEDEALRRLGHPGVEVEVRYVPGAVEGTVVSQTPQEGAALWPADEDGSGPREGFGRVVLHVVDADLPAPAPAPNVVGLDVDAAVTGLEMAAREASVLQSWLGAAQLGEDGEVLRQRELADGRIELVVARRVG